jgi:hypothetical protein
MKGCATRLQGDLRKVHGDRPWLSAALTLAFALWGAAAGATEATPLQSPPRSASASTLEHRVAMLTKALDLDARQQAELQGIFASQRQAVRKIWNDPALLPAERVPATRAVEDRTADQIRAMLNDEQKKKYNPPKPPPAPDTGPPDVSAWMDATRKK